MEIVIFNNACNSQQKELVIRLLERNMDPSIYEVGLMTACTQGKLEIAKLIIERHNQFAELGAGHALINSRHEILDYIFERFPDLKTKLEDKWFTNEYLSSLYGGYLEYLKTKDL